MELRRLERLLRKARACRDAAENRAFLSNGASEQIERDWDHEVSEITIEIDVIKSANILRQARRYDLPDPIRTDVIEFDPNWNIDAYRLYLTPVGRALVRNAIRQERRERWESIARWLPLLAALTGVLGTAIGVLSFLQK